MNFVYSLRLQPGDDLRLALQKFCQDKKIGAGSIVSAVGSLQVASLRFADAKTSARLAGPFEIVALSGTLSQSGMHLHIALADKLGTVVGGHVTEGNLIHTTCELVILEQNNILFLREQDERTGYQELMIKPRASS